MNLGDDGTEGRPAAPGPGEPLTPEERDRAVQLILRGRAGADPATWEDRDLVRRYFKGITSSDLNSALNEFQLSEWRTHRQEAAQLLIAYFIWCKTEHFGAVPIGESDIYISPDRGNIDFYLWRFMAIGFSRMTGLEVDYGGFRFEGFDLPRWRNPDSGFGWKGIGRPRSDDTWRSVAIVCFIERERRRGKRPRRAVREACERFSGTPGKPLAVATVEKALKRLGWNLDDWQPIPDSDEALEREISLGLDGAEARRTGKKSADD